MVLFVIDPSRAVICGFYALFNPLDTLCADLDIRIPEVAVPCIVFRKMKIVLSGMKNMEHMYA